AEEHPVPDPADRGVRVRRDALRFRGERLLVAERLRGDGARGRDPGYPRLRLRGARRSPGLPRRMARGGRRRRDGTRGDLGRVGALPILLRVGRPRRGGGVRPGVRQHRPPAVHGLDHLRPLRRRHRFSPRPGPAHDGPRQSQGDRGRM
ncbi:MAG: hypothetical protein AVDCRST_MAG22-1361, partial [uncultured Rubrobacteraceae bacterium]